MKKLLILIMLLMNFMGRAQNNAYTVSTDPDGGSLIFNGPVTFNDLDNEPRFTWLKKGRDEYKPDETKMAYLRQHLGDYTMVVFLGTWCDDSHELIPKLEKALQQLSYPANKFTMYATDLEKKTKGGEQKQYKITLVPTVILFRNGKEAGRITESVEKSIEADLAAIIEKSAQAH